MFFPCIKHSLCRIATFQEKRTLEAELDQKQTEWRQLLEKIDNQFKAKRRKVSSDLEEARAQGMSAHKKTTIDILIKVRSFDLAHIFMKKLTPCVLDYTHGQSCLPGVPDNSYFPAQHFLTLTTAKGRIFPIDNSYS